MCRKDRAKNHEDGRIQLTSHRIIYIDTLAPLKHSVYLDLSLVRQTEYWIGIYFKSSPKITLIIGADSTVEASQNDGSDTGTSSGSSWVCRVCGMSNTGTIQGKCGLCGVINSVTALPSRLSTPNLSTASLPNLLMESVAAKKENGIICPTCTFLNHPSMEKCEVCDSKLGVISLPKSSSSTSLPISKSNSETSISLPFIKLSFRKGGEKVFHTNLKKALGDRVWESDTSLSKALNGKKVGGGIGE